MIEPRRRRGHKQPFEQNHWCAGVLDVVNRQPIVQGAGVVVEAVIVVVLPDIERPRYIVSDMTQSFADPEQSKPEENDQ